MYRQVETRLQVTNSVPFNSGVTQLRLFTHPMAVQENTIEEDERRRRKNQVAKGAEEVALMEWQIPPLKERSREGQCPSQKNSGF